MHGRRAATAAHDAGARLQQGRHVFAEVFRAGRVGEAALNARRIPRVGHGADGPSRVRLGDGGHGLQHLRRTDRAVHADHVRAAAGEPGRDVRRSVAGRGYAALGIGHGGEDRKVADAPSRVHADLQFRQIREGLEQQEICARFPERLDLLGEDGGNPVAFVSVHARRQLGRPAPPSGPTSPAMKRLLPDTSRTSRTSFTALKLKSRTLSSSPCLARRRRLAPKVCAGDDIRAGRSVRLVDCGHPFRARLDQLLQALGAAGAARIEHRAHSAVGQQRPLLQFVEKRIHGTGAFLNACTPPARPRRR